MTSPRAHASGPPRTREEMPSICAACREPIGGRFQITDGKVYILCDGADCSRWASIRGMRIVQRGTVDTGVSRLW